MIKKIDNTISLYAIRDAKTNTYLSKRGWKNLSDKVRVFNMRNHATSAIHSFMKEQGREAEVVEFIYTIDMIKDSDGTRKWLAEPKI